MARTRRPEGAWEWTKAIGAAFVQGMALDPNYYDPDRRIRKLREEATKPKFKPLESERAWRAWFDKQTQAEWVSAPTKDKMDLIDAELRDRARGPKAQAALIAMSGKPTANAVDVAGVLRQNGGFVIGMERLFEWASARKTLKELLPSVKDALVTMRSTGLAAQIKIDDEAAIYDAVGYPDLATVGKFMASFTTATTRTLSYSMVAMNINMVARHTERLGVSPRDAMSWLVKNTSEGDGLVKVLGSFGSFDRQITGRQDVSLAPIWDQLDPGVANVLQDALGIQTTPTNSALGLGGQNL